MGLGDAESRIRRVAPATPLGGGGLGVGWGGGGALKAKALRFEI